jgi:riboflavin biosynthesis pyrimidine reductase
LRPFGALRDADAGVQAKAWESWIARDFGEIWRAADKVAYTRTLDTVSSARTLIARNFDPDAVRQMKSAQKRDLTVGGPAPASRAVQAGLVDEYHLFIAPVVAGGAIRSVPEGVRLEVELLAERRFRNGMLHLHYRRRL